MVSKLSNRFFLLQFLPFSCLGLNHFRVIYPITYTYDSGTILMVSKLDRSRILRNEISDNYDRLQGFSDLREEADLNGYDMYDFVIKECFELKIVAECYKVQMENWIEYKLNIIKGSEEEILNQINTILQGFEL